MARGVRFSKAKLTGSWRVKAGRRVLHATSRSNAKTSATYFIKAGAKEVEIQERYPSGTWITTDIVTLSSLPL